MSACNLVSFYSADQTSITSKKARLDAQIISNVDLPVVVIRCDSAGLKEKISFTPYLLSRCKTLVVSSGVNRA